MIYVRYKRGYMHIPLEAPIVVFKSDSLGDFDVATQRVFPPYPARNAQDMVVETRTRPTHGQRVADRIADVFP